MSNLTKLEFVALDIIKKNYLYCTIDAKIHLDAMNLRVAIKKRETSILAGLHKSVDFLQHHIHENLKSEYFIVKDPLTL